MQRFLLWAFGLALVLAAAFAGVRMYALHLLEQNAFSPNPTGQETPATYGAPFDTLRLASGDHTLAARWVPAPDSILAAPSVLLLHGNGETVASWAEAQAMLRAQGIASLVIDYAGYGESTGTPGLDALEADVVAGYAALTERAQGKRYLLGHSLGAAPMLAVAPRLVPPPDGLVASAPWSSVRVVATRTGLIKEWQQVFIPNVWYNVENARQAPAPLLVVRGTRDRLIDEAMARSVAEAAPASSYAEVPGGTHNGLYEAPTPDYWAATLAFLRGGVQP